MSARRESTALPTAAWTAVVVAFVLGFLLALAGSSGSSPTADEPTYLGQGRYLVGSGDMEAPVLLWQPPAALLLTSATLGAADPPDAAFEQRPDENSLTDLGDRLLWESGLDPERVLFWSRLPVALVCGLLGAWGAFVAARLTLGERPATAAWVAGLLLAASPPMFAHGGLATTDLPATFAGLLALGLAALVVRGDRVPTRRAVLVVGAALGLALATKHTNLLLVPLLGLALPWISRRRGASWGTALGRGVYLTAGAVFVVWASYAFHVGALLPPHSSGDLAARLADRVPLPTEWTLYLAESFPVPAPRYFQSIVFQASKQHGRLYFRYFDELAKVGWWSFFPVVTVGKLTVASLLLFLTAGWVSVRRRAWREARALGVLLLLAFATLFGAAVASRHNLGVRHVLPALAPLLLWIGTALGREAAGRRVWIAALLGLHLVEAGHAVQGPVAWWNALYGGPTRGFHVSAGADGDWGQGAWELRRLADENDWKPLLVVYRGPESTAPHLGTDWLTVAENHWNPELPAEGWIAVSTSTLAPERKPTFEGAEPVGYPTWCYRLYRLPFGE